MDLSLLLICVDFYAERSGGPDGAQDVVPAAEADQSMFRSAAYKRRQRRKQQLGMVAQDGVLHTVRPPTNRPVAVVRPRMLSAWEITLAAAERADASATATARAAAAREVAADEWPANVLEGPYNVFVPAVEVLRRPYLHQIRHTPKRNFLYLQPDTLRKLYSGSLENPIEIYRTTIPEPSNDFPPPESPPPPDMSPYVAGPSQAHFYDGDY